MMRSLKPRLTVLLCLPLIGSGCSTIKSWFPDKERDYQFTSEIPELIVPTDLKAGALTMVAASPRAEDIHADVSEPRAEATRESAPIETESAAAIETPQVAPVSALPVGSSLQIDQPMKQAGRIVARAMSRQKLEIVERNIDKGYFYVRFDPDATTVVDEDSILDEIKFLLGDDPSQELEYRVALHEINPQLTEVSVQNSEGKPLATRAANQLLKMITDAINQDVSKDEIPQSEP